MGYTVKFKTTIEWEITEEEARVISECETPEAFIKYQENLLKPRYTGRQSLEDFVANGVIKAGDWVVETVDDVEDFGIWRAE